MLNFITDNLEAWFCFLFLTLNIGVFLMTKNLAVKAASTDHGCWKELHKTENQLAKQMEKLASAEKRLEHLEDVVKVLVAQSRPNQSLERYD